MKGLRFISIPRRYRRRPCRYLFATHWRTTKRILPPIFYSSLRFYCRVGYWPHIKRPKSFNEKVLFRNHFSADPLLALVSDKYKVREYVADKVGTRYLNDLLFVTQNPDEIPFDDLPEKYVIKASHGCGWNIFVDGSEPVDRNETINTCRKWLNTTYGLAGYETMYEKIVPRIMVEKFIETEGHSNPHDYKYYCFHGKVKCIVFQIDRYEKLKQTFYDENWNQLDMTMRIPVAEPVDRPALLEEMIQVAERLSEDFDFARVDLYSPNDKRVLFGEYTVSPASAGMGLRPLEWDWKLGSYWNIS